ncbi:unnamed protein product [Blepharisma stoltei]|uniref:Uncharacterized protein n=1 Tax=Blepharisma stoltei TaxID=1481888 RepID=A0AAU9IVX3_9CILI|nr:unnamed protein product [Blepharisma stoltei]
MMDYKRSLSNISEVSERNEQSEKTTPTNCSSQSFFHQALVSISEDEQDSDLSPRLLPSKTRISRKESKDTADETLRSVVSNKRKSIFGSNQDLDQLVSLRINGDKCSCTCIMF